MKIRITLPDLKWLIGEKKPRSKDSRKNWSVKVNSYRSILDEFIPGNIPSLSSVVSLVVTLSVMLSVSSTIFSSLNINSHTVTNHDEANTSTNDVNTIGDFNSWFEITNVGTISVINDANYYSMIHRDSVPQACPPGQALQQAGTNLFCYRI